MLKTAFNIYTAPAKAVGLAVGYLTKDAYAANAHNKTESLAVSASMYTGGILGLGLGAVMGLGLGTGLEHLLATNTAYPQLAVSGMTGLAYFTRAFAATRTSGSEYTL